MPLSNTQRTNHISFFCALYFFPVRSNGAMVSIVTKILYKIQVVKILFAKAVTEESERDAEGSTFFVVQNNKLYTKDGRSHCDIICGFLPF